MVECPVCGATSLPNQAVCGVCGLPTEFFEVLSERGDALPEPTTSPAERDSPGPTETVQPWWSRPAQEDRTVSPQAVSSPNDPLSSEPPSPATGAEGNGDDSEAPTDAALRIGRSLGMNLENFEKALASASAERRSTPLSRVRRELIRSVLDRFLARYRTLSDRRGALSSVVRTQALDRELASFRKALAEGDLNLANEQRLKAEAVVESLEGSWNRIQTQIAETGQMMRALRELGGVAPAVLRPVVDAIRIPRRGEAGEIEERLKKANDLLWGLLVPRMDFEISKGRSLLNSAKASVARTNLIRREIDRMAEEIRSQKIAEALESRRFVRAELASVTPRAPRASVRRSFIE
jgi:hypothetical protein